MPVADWNERSRISFQASPPNARGMMKLTRMRIQPMASVPSGATTGVPAGLIAVGVAAETAVVAVAVTVGVIVWLVWAETVLGPAVKVKITCVRTPSSTSVVAN